MKTKRNEAGGDGYQEIVWVDGGHQKPGGTQCKVDIFYFFYFFIFYFGKVDMPATKYFKVLFGKPVGQDDCGYNLAFTSEQGLSVNNFVSHMIQIIILFLHHRSNHRH